MTGSIGAGGTLPPFSAKPIEQRVKAEYEQVVDSSGAQARLDALMPRYEELSAAHDAAEDKATSWRTTKTVGLPVLIGAGVLGLGGAIVGKFTGGGGGGAAIAGAAAVGAAVGAGGGLFVGVLSHWIDDYVTSSGGTQQNGVRLEPSKEFSDLGKQIGQLNREIEALPDPERIKPGEAWVTTPRGGETLLGGRKTSVDGLVDKLMAMHDHDGNGELRLDETARTPRNELLRSRAGGPIVGASEITDERIAAVRELPIDLQRTFDSNGDGSLSRQEIVAGMQMTQSTEDHFGLQASQLARYDADTSGSLTRDELAEGVVRDAATAAHAMYFVTYPDGTVPPIVHDRTRTDSFRAYG